MWETYSEYIIWYIIIGFVHFLWCYGVSVRAMTKINKLSFRTKASINWGHLIFLKGVFWPIGFVMDIIKFISKIGV